MKQLLFFLIGVVVFLGIFFGLGFHYYFIDTVADEEIAFEAPLIPEGEDVEVLTPEEVVVASGQLQRLDALHAGEGLVELVELGERTFVRFNEVDITNGPDLYVYVSDQDVPEGTVLSLGEYTDLGRLRGNKGTLIYEIPQDLSHDINSVVVWCDKFSVLFTYASIE